MKFTSPFYKFVPKDLKANLAWRLKLNKAAIDNREIARLLYEACAIDILFYINSFVWTHDTRQSPFTKLPFITYEYQDRGIRDIVNAIFFPHDILIDKSRDTGASWICIIVFEWIWHFSQQSQMLLFGSRNKDYVDKSDNPKALFWKLDYLIDNLPGWLKPAGYDKHIHRTLCHILNLATGSVIDGEATTGDFARGDRRLAILLDEFAAVYQGNAILPATRDATKCRIFNSTPHGIDNAYYDIYQTPIKTVVFDWKDDPRKNQGLYTTDSHGQLKLLGKGPLPKNYKPILDGEVRSVQYDIEEARSNPREMAQEWRRDFLGSGHQFFSGKTIQKLMVSQCRPPIHKGELEYDTTSADPIKFHENEQGCLLLWSMLDINGQLSQNDKYTLGIDISSGTGASNSCISGWSQKTKEKVLEYVNPYIRPEEFAKQAVAIAKWLGGAYMIWESQGSSSFRARVLDLGYRNIYYRRREESITKKQTTVPGWHSNRVSKEKLLGYYRSSLETGEAINFSREALQECLEYIYDNTEGICHARANNREDPSGAKQNHGDRVIADALGWKIVEERHSLPKLQDPEVPVGSLKWRQQERERYLRDKKEKELVGW